MNKFIVHIGPPKTASTSLQLFFQNLTITNLEYLGVHQPRGVIKDSISNLLYKKIVGNIQYFDQSIIKKKLDNSNVLISEEMLTLHSESSSWKDKLSELRNIFNEFNVELLIILREPISAIKSYYQEIYYTLDKTRIKNINDFALSNYCEIYNYLNLSKELKNIGFSNLILLDYNKLVKGEYSLQDLGIKSKQQVLLTHSNKSIKSKKEYYANNFNIRDRILSKVPQGLKKVISLQTKEKLVKLIPNRKLTKVKKLDVNISDEIKEIFENSYNEIITTLR